MGHDGTWTRALDIDCLSVTDHRGSTAGSHGLWPELSLTAHRQHQGGRQTLFSPRQYRSKERVNLYTRFKPAHYISKSLCIILSLGDLCTGRGRGRCTKVIIRADQTFMYYLFNSWISRKIFQLWNTSPTLKTSWMRYKLISIIMYVYRVVCLWFWLVDIGRLLSPNARWIGYFWYSPWRGLGSYLPTSSWNVSFNMYLMFMYMILCVHVYGTKSI